jgi:dolichyl-phosphate-mannose--protein O-mannosyl transferase
VVGLAAGLRLTGLGRVDRPYWDETFYAADASAYLGRTPADQRPGHPSPDIAENSWMQPPLGKWLIASGELVAGRGPWGYRFPAAVAGTASVLLAYALARRLSGSLVIAGLGGVLLALDGLHIVQSRVAMLDVFSSTFILGGLLFLIRARAGPAADRSGEACPKSEGAGPRPATLVRAAVGTPRSFLAAGALLGAGVACKWAGIPYLLVAAGLGWRWLRRLYPAWSRSQMLTVMVVCFGLVPAAVYMASYTSFFLRHGFDPVGFLRLQWAMLQYGRHFDYGSTAASPAWSWPLLRGSIDYTQAVYFGGGIRIVSGNIAVLRVLTAGNPVLWWAFLASAPFLIWLAVARRRWAPALVVLGYLAAWAPWLVPGRTTFQYYMLPAVPFMAIGVALAVQGLARGLGGSLRPVGVAVGASLVGGAGAAAWAYYPVWTAMPVGFYHFAALRLLPGIH